MLCYVTRPDAVVMEVEVEAKANGEDCLNQVRGRPAPAALRPPPPSRGARARCGGERGPLGSARPLVPDRRAREPAGARHPLPWRGAFGGGGGEGGLREQHGLGGSRRPRGARSGP